MTANRTKNNWKTLGKLSWLSFLAILPVQSAEQPKPPAVSLSKMAGLPLRPNQHLDGLSLVPLLDGTRTTLDREALFFHFPQDHHVNSMGPSGAIRAGDFKLVEACETREVELYKLKEDLGEQNDLSESMPEKTAELRDLLHQWHEETGARLSLKKRGSH